MSLRLLVDEDAQDKLLVKFLRDAGHDVITANQASLMGEDDEIVLDYAKKEKRFLLTFNCDDFQALHEVNSIHSGIFVVYHNNDFSKNMSYREILQAIANVESAGITLTNQFIRLNQWNY